MSSMHSTDTNYNPVSAGAGHESIYNDNKNSMGWLLPLLLLVLTAGLVMYFLRGCSENAAVATVLTDTAGANIPADTIAVQSNGRKTLSIKLADSMQITAYKNGIENQLILYITSENGVDIISKNRWFDFDDLNFKTGSAEITDSSMRQVRNIAAILKAYPSVKIKIGGYTDKTGNEALNMQLSQARADAVLTALQDAGANPKQLTGAEGYGSKFAKAEIGAPDAEKQKDRRISLNIKEK